CGGYGILLLNPSHHHAQMRSFNNHSNTQWLQGSFYSIQDLGSQSFLHLQAAGIYIYNPCNFTQSGYPAVGYISNMRFAKKRQHMMFAHAVYFDILNYDHFTDRLVELGRI